MRKGLFSLLKQAGILSILFVLSACSDGGNGASTERDSDAGASYRVTLTTTWTPTDFSTNFPAGAHFTTLIGGTHSDQVIFWEPGQNASLGIERVAEDGAMVSLSAEFDAAKADGKAEFIIASGSVSTAGTTVLEFDINKLLPLVTLVSMVAPSPDWFIGVHDVSLFDDAKGDWKQAVVVDLAVYDAGTEDGQAFSRSNAATSPVQPIELLSRVNAEDHDFVDGVGAAGKFIATIAFERIK